MTEQITTVSQIVFAAIVIIAVFIVMVATIYFHAKKRVFSEQTASLLKWLIRVLVYLFIASISVPGLRSIANFLK
jgi:uncharacterized membrane protein